MNLERDGVAVVRVFTQQELEGVQTRLAEMEYPEFLHVDHSNAVMGVFGAHGNPSSFHHPTIRMLRGLIKSRVVGQVFRHYADKRVESMFDRLCFRKKGKGQSAESWHQDIAPSADGSKFFQGWTNLSMDVDQALAGVPGSHGLRFDGAATEGFSAVPPQHRAPFEAYFKTNGVIVVPPGFAIVFEQGLVHKVNPKPPKEDSYRLFHGFRISQWADGDTPIPFFFHASAGRPSMNEVLTQLAVPPLPSGQMPPMFAALHVCFNSDKITEFARTLNPVFTRIQPSGKSEGKLWPNVNKQRVMPSLRSVGMCMGPEYDYDARDKGVLWPQPVVNFFFD